MTSSRGSSHPSSTAGGRNQFLFLYKLCWWLNSLLELSSFLHPRGKGGGGRHKIDRYKVSKLDHTFISDRAQCGSLVAHESPECPVCRSCYKLSTPLDSYPCSTQTIDTSPESCHVPGVTGTLTTVDTAMATWAEVTPGMLITMEEGEMGSADITRLTGPAADYTVTSAAAGWSTSPRASVQRQRWSYHETFVHENWILSWLQDEDHEDSGLCPELVRAMEGVKYIAEVTRIVEDSNKVECSYFVPHFHFSDSISFQRKRINSLSSGQMLRLIMECRRHLTWHPLQVSCCQQRSHQIFVSPTQEWIFC